MIRRIPIQEQMRWEFVVVAVNEDPAQMRFAQSQDFAHGLYHRLAFASGHIEYIG